MPVILGRGKKKQQKRIGNIRIRTHREINPPKENDRRKYEVSVSNLH